MNPSELSSLKKKSVINVIVGQAGGGHYATYNAIRAVAEQQNLPWEFQITDIDEIVGQLAAENKVKNVYEMLGISGHDLYNLMQKTGWTWLFPLKMWMNKFLMKLNHDVGVQIFEEYWLKHKPDLVLSLMPLYNKPLWESVDKSIPGTPYVTVMIDFADYPPAFWIEPETESYTVCGTQKAVEQARDLGAKEEYVIKTSGMAIHPRFYEPMPEDSSYRQLERQKLGLDPHCLTGIVMFGGNGSKAMLDIAERLESFHEKLQLIFICGRNEELAQAIKDSPGLQKRFVTTFTKEIPYYMNLADFFIGKPGPGSISEAMVMNLPAIVERNLSTVLMERYNTDWIQEKEVGLVIPNFRHIHKAVEKFLEPDFFACYRNNVAAVNNRGVFEVADILQQVLADNDIKRAAKPLEQKL